LGDNYEVRGLVGQGGFAEVFELWDRGLARRLAAKVLRPDIAWTQGMIARFKDECRVLASLNHPNILPIHFVGEGQGLVYYIMPYVEGQSLGGYLRSHGALEVARALEIAVPVLEALGHAHQAGLLHRDIKPDNVLIDGPSGRALLVDFGIAKRLDSRPSQRTQTGFVIGTPQYMSPEQALGQLGIDARSDLYAFGALLFQMVTGAPPYDGDSSQEIVGKHIADPIPVPVDRNALIPVWLSDIIVRCLAKKPADRYQSVAQLLEAIQVGRESGPTRTETAEHVAQRLGQLDPGEPTVPVPPPPLAGPPSPTQPGRSTWRRWVAAATLVAAAGIGAWLLFLRPVTLVVVNRFDAPLTLALPDGSTRTVAASSRQPVAISATGFIRLTWSVPARSGPDGAPRGDAPSGELQLELPRGSTQRAVGLADARINMFEPLITNAGTRPIRITVNHGLAGAQSCECEIAPGGVRVSAGYYPLHLNSTVRATDPSGRSAMFRDLGPQVDRRLGKVGLRFEDRDFR
jgi:serine/threonine-protein kinase